MDMLLRLSKIVADIFTGIRENPEHGIFCVEILFNTCTLFAIPYLQ
jgi:hypothetical protein